MHFFGILVVLLHFVMFAFNFHSLRCPRSYANICLCHILYLYVVNSIHNPFNEKWIKKACLGIISVFSLCFLKAIPNDFSFLGAVCDFWGSLLSLS